ncbi:hypothetical protein EON79_05190 [bacterium]|nr:MAG: hypothetical protein EON79_05190 [bacterium]
MTMRIMTLGRWAAPALFLSLFGCGGTGSLEKAVPFRATLEAGTGDNVTMIVTRSNRLPGEGTECRLEQTNPDWCSANFQTLRYNVQPSYTLYRVYVRNLSTTGSAAARVSIQKDGEGKGTATATIPAGHRRLAPRVTLGIEPCFGGNPGQAGVHLRPVSVLPQASVARSDGNLFYEGARTGSGLLSCGVRLGILLPDRVGLE